MDTTEEKAALAAVQSTSVPIHDIGTAIYLSPDVMGWAGEWGWSNPFAFYFAGRGGMLGEVSDDVVTSAFGWFCPDAVSAMYNEGVSIAGARGAADRMAEAHSRWGREALRAGRRTRGGDRSQRGGGQRVGGLGHPAVRRLARRAAQ